MRPGVDFAQGSDRDFGVNLRGVEPCVSEQLLDQADVRAVLQHVRGAAVAEQWQLPPRPMSACLIYLDSLRLNKGSRGLPEFRRPDKPGTARVFHGCPLIPYLIS
jgi:hypothetical protein